MVRYGIVGFGLHAVRRIMPAFAQATNSQAVALTRRDKHKAEENAREYKIPLVFGSAEELCKHPDIDAVFVATPNICHLNDVLTAAKHGKHVLCEKPLGMNSDECRQMIEGARNAGVKFGVAQVFRFCHSVDYIRERSAGLGKVAAASAEFHYPGWSHPRTWLNNREIGGGIIADVGVHCIDTLRYVLQDEVVRVQAQAKYDKESGDVDAAGSLTLEFGRGALVTVSVSMRAQYFTRLSLVGEKGAITSDYAITVDTPVRVNVFENGNVVESPEFTNYDCYARMLDAFADSVERGTEFPCPGEEGLRNQMILDAAYASVRSGEAISLPELATRI